MWTCAPHSWAQVVFEEMLVVRCVDSLACRCSMTNDDTFAVVRHYQHNLHPTGFIVLFFFDVMVPIIGLNLEFGLVYPCPLLDSGNNTLQECVPLRCGISPDGIQLLRTGAISVLLSGYGEPSVQQIFSCGVCSSGCATLMTEPNFDG
jgi:hypothetical protein